MSAEVKYTDRDVRENFEFAALAEQYVMEYEGDFQFLIDMKMRVASEIELTVGMVRGVLNCMRHDPRVRNLPEPVHYEFDADVVPIREGYPRRLTSMGGRDNQKHPIKEIKPRELRNNGEYRYRLPATVHPEFIFVKGKSTSTIKVHLVTEAEIEWHPHRYVDQPGWAYKPELIVHTNCKYPYYMRNPLLLTPEHVAENADLERCHYCFYMEE